MIHESVYELRKTLVGSLGVAHGKVEVLDAEKLRSEDIDALVRDAVFGTEPVQVVCALADLGSGAGVGRTPGEHP